MCYAIWTNVKRLCIVVSLMRPRWLFCGTLAPTCLFNLLTALTQKSPTVHRTNPIHCHCYPMSKHLFIVANGESTTDILITSEMILLEVIFHHRLFFLPSNEMSHVRVYWPIKTQRGHHITGDLWSCQSERLRLAVFTSQCKVIVSSMN